MATHHEKQVPASTKQTRGVLGRSAATGRFVLKPASKGGSISVQAAKTAARNVGNGHKK